MIECANCETAQFLQITRSRVYFEADELLREIDERYECTLCGATGSYTYTGTDNEVDPDASATVAGGVTLTRRKPEHA
ncbi:hypothetical protein [Saliphagus infecundisoli]|uniref:Uncharacterized protein n=1 Tax=Saliphagus infecundisoli TaxID=1849069 RepID=A0ABD5QHY0_9EURY|nr:hypothetical protein [Saliphagus infecundisoli]